jgi:hypothetical protein
MRSADSKGFRLHKNCANSAPTRERIRRGGRGEASSWNGLILDHVEANDAGFLSVLEVAGDGIADHRFQFVESIGFGENGEAECAGLIATFRRLLNREDNFALEHVC